MFTDMNDRRIETETSTVIPFHRVSFPNQFALQFRSS